MKVNIKKLDENAIVPKYQTAGASGFDLHALEDTYVGPCSTVLVKTGLAFDIGPGYELQARPRSGLTLKTPLRVHFGTCDSDYRGDVGVIVWNTSQTMPFEIKKGERIAQGVICPVVQADFEVVDELNDTVRGSSGFGSTG